MRVILTENVTKLGNVGDVCTVAAGYGRNYLLPRKMAILATPGALKQIDDLRRTERRRQDRLRAEMTDMAARIGRQRLEFSARVGEQGRLYGSITTAQIAHALEEKLGEPVDRHKIRLDESIRTLGQHEVPLHLMPGVDATIHITVVGLESEHPPATIAQAESASEPAQSAESPADAAAIGTPPADAAATIVTDLATEDIAE